MMRLALALTTAALLACAVEAEAAMSVKDEMKQLVEPASNVLFALGGEADPANGPDQPKPSDARWAEGAAAAKALATAAGDLAVQPRPGSEWKASADEMGRLADAAMKAAQAKDGAALAEAANALADTCSACHAKYKPQTAD